MKVQLGTFEISDIERYAVGCGQKATREEVIDYVFACARSDLPARVNEYKLDRAAQLEREAAELRQEVTVD